MCRPESTTTQSRPEIIVEIMGTGKIPHINPIIINYYVISMLIFLEVYHVRSSGGCQLSSSDLFMYKRLASRTNSLSVAPALSKALQQHSTRQCSSSQPSRSFGAFALRIPGHPRMLSDASPTNSCS